METIMAGCVRVCVCVCVCVSIRTDYEIQSGRTDYDTARALN